MRKIAVTVALLLAGTSFASAGDLSIWWVKGFYPAEDKALDSVIEKFEKETGTKVEITRFASKDFRTKIAAAVDAGSLPDIAAGDLQSNTNGDLAFKDKLVDLTDVLDPMKSEFIPSALAASSLLDGATGKRAYYSFPIDQQVQGVFYWKDMLKDAGFSDVDIPTGFEDYWSFWCGKVQTALRNKGQRVYGFGLTYGPGTDTPQAMYAFLDAYNVKLLNADGSPRFDEPDVREGLIKALTSFTNASKEGCSPPSSVNWTDPDNNQAFHARQIVATINNSISIPGKWLDDSHNQTLTEEQRNTAKDNYENKIGTITPPKKKPDGTPLPVRATVNAGVVFKQGPNNEAAKKFVAFLLKDENLSSYVEETLGRYFPVKLKAIEDPIWQSDPHRKAVYNAVKAGTAGNEFTLNYKFSIANNQGVWQKAAGDIITNGVPVEKATDDLLAELKRIFAD